jgi:hypothetical protein
MYAGLEDQTNWIPVSFQKAAPNLGKEIVSKFVKNDQVALKSIPGVAEVGALQVKGG